MKRYVGFVTAAVVTLMLISPGSPPARGAGETEWTRQFGSSAWDGAEAVAIGAEVFVAGGTEGTLPGQVSAGSTDAFVRKYDLDGNELWTRQFGTNGGDVAHGLAVHDFNTYVVGDVFGTLPGQISSGSTDVFLRKYDENGNELWTRQFGTTDQEIAYGVAADSTGVYIAGQTQAVFQGQTSAGAQDAFLRKYDHSGTEIWTRQFGTLTGDGATGVATDSSGVYVVGSTSGALPGQTQAGTDAFVRKYDRDGNELWTHQFGSTQGDHAQAVATDSSGVYIAGVTDGTMPGATNSGDYDTFVRKYDHGGNQIWTRQFGSSGWDHTGDIAVDASGVHVAGSTPGVLPGQTSGGGDDGFVRTYDHEGVEVGTYQFGTVSADHALGVATGSSGPYVAGYTAGTWTGQISAGGTDAFVTKLSGTPGIQLERAVVLIQGIDSESSNPGCTSTAKGFLENGTNRVGWIHQDLPSRLQQAGLDVNGERDFFYFSYSGLYCDADGHQRPVYDPEHTCYGIDDHSSNYEQTGAAEKFDVLMQDVLGQYEKVDIVAHSMGGMVAAYWLVNHPTLKNRINSIATFDSPLRGTQDTLPSPPSHCPSLNSASWVDLWCEDFSRSTDRDKCLSIIVDAIKGAGNLVPFFTIDATQQGLGYDYVPENRASLLASASPSASRLHCQFDDGHSSVWENRSLSVTLGHTDDAVCWTYMTWPPSTSGNVIDPYAKDAKLAFLTCAMTMPASPSLCLADIGETQLPEGTIDSPVLAGATTVQVADNSAFDVGDAVRFNPGMPNQETRTVVDLGSLILNEPLEFDHSAGEPIYIIGTTGSSTPTPTPTATPTPFGQTPTPTPTPTSTPTPTPTAVPDGVKGDGDCDGDVDAVDALKTLRYVAALPYSRNAGCPVLGSEIVAAALVSADAHAFGDIDCDSDVDAVDALWILRFVAAMPAHLPQGCAEIGS